MDTDTSQPAGTEIVSETPSAPAPTAEAPSATEPTSDSPEATEGGEETPKSAAPAYVPNYKLKVYDEEKELDDPFLKELIKDAESEKKVKEIAQKYLGFDTVKSRNEKLKGEFQQYQQTAQPVMEYYSKASNMLQKGNLEGFFEMLQIPNDAIFRYAVQKAEEANLAPEQQHRLQQQRESAKQQEYLESQNQTLQTQQQQQLSQFRAQELGWMMQRPDVVSVASSFDQRVGKPGAFRQAVIEKGLAHHAATGQDLSAEQATMEIVKLLGAVVTPTTQTAPVQGQPLIQQNGQPPIIPNVTGRGASPVKKQVRSLDDLKKKRNEFQQRDSS